MFIEKKVYLFLEIMYKIMRQTKKINNKNKNTRKNKKKNNKQKKRGGTVLGSGSEGCIVDSFCCGDY